MRKRWAVVGFVSAMGLALAIWQTAGASAAPTPDQMASAIATSTSYHLGLADAEYVGNTKCKKCHLPEHKSWETKKHAKALELLKPGQATEAKAKFKLDPNKDYSKDATCVGCHTVGFGKPGGYQIPADEEAAKKMKALEGVGCEACHGAGGKYLDLHDEIMKSKRKYKESEMVAAGLVIPNKDVCVTCHNDKSPTFDASKPFDFEKMKAEGVHEITPLKQKEQ